MYFTDDKAVTTDKPQTNADYKAADISYRDIDGTKTFNTLPEQIE